MTIAMSVDEKHSCLLCDYDFRDADARLARDRLLAHLSNVHHRTMVSESERKNTRIYSGPRWKNDEAR